MIATSMSVALVTRYQLRLRWTLEVSTMRLLMKVKKTTKKMNVMRDMVCRKAFSALVVSLLADRWNQQVWQEAVAASITSLHQWSTTIITIIVARWRMTRSAM